MRRGEGENGTGTRPACPLCVRVGENGNGHAGRVTVPGGGVAAKGGHAGCVTVPGETASELPVRKRLDHRGPLSIDVSGAWYFITICAEDRNEWVRSRVPRDRGGEPMDFHAIANAILSAARWYHEHEKWRLALFLVMPTHLHFIVHFPDDGGHAGRVTVPMGRVTVPMGRMTVPMVATIQHFKSYLARTFGIKCKRDFFDTRLRDDAHYAEKFRYICNNPVRKGLCSLARDWPYVIAFDRVTGTEREHRGSGHAGRVTVPGVVGEAVGGHAGRVTVPSPRNVVEPGAEGTGTRPACPMGDDGHKRSIGGCHET